MSTLTKKRIASIEVIKPGSDPDVDSDFHTKVREKTIEYVNKEYGNVANILTYNTLKAKKAFKAMCNIYDVPYAEAEKITKLIPEGMEGKDPKMADLYDPDSDFYHDAVEFRSATMGPEWTNIIDGAIAIEGRNDSIGMHACGVIISSKPLEDVIPTQVRQKDGVTFSQWTYPELESIGLIKMDFLGLDTVDLIQQAVENIKSTGKEAPSMLKLIHGPMDDKKTYELLGRADTIGIFQLSGDGMRELLRTMKPTEFMDIAAANALFRPGPMGMGSHTKYALRKNGLEKVDFPVHPEFKGTELEEILKDTYFLVVYQEQIIQIANRIAGMTLQEGDDLRKAMGKKKRDVMESMRPVFFDGARKNGFSDEAITELWDTIETFAQYGFNLSHSVAYAMNGYQSAYLKANYPVEFMAALINQRVGEKDKTRLHLQEAKRMGIKVGPVSANNSKAHVMPATGGEYDIVYGFSGVAAVSDATAEIIVAEREKNGDFQNPEDFVKRCYKAGITKKDVFEKLTYAGAFDEMGKTRKSIIESIPKFISGAKTSSVKGLSLFDLMGGKESESVSIQYTDEEFDYGDKLRLEANTIGTYISGHPMGKLTKGDLSKINATTLEEMFLYRGKTKKFRVVAVPTEVTVRNKRGKSIILKLEDNTSTVDARVHKDVVKAIDKRIARERFKDLYKKGNTGLDDIYKIATDSNVGEPREDILENRLYVFDVLFRPSWDENTLPGISVVDFQEFKLTSDGRMPVRVRFKAVKTKNGIQALSKADISKALKEVETKLKKRAKGETSKGYDVNIPILISRYRAGNLKIEVENVEAYKKALEQSRTDDGADVTAKKPREKKKSPKKKSELFSDKTVEVVNKRAKGKTATSDLRQWPPAGVEAMTTIEIKETDRENYAKALNNIRYIDSGRKSSKILNLARQILAEYGVENSDVDSGFVILED